jgi:uracil-DNA glycosylase family 4
MGRMATPEPTSGAPGTDAPARRERLTELFHRARGCELCPQLVAGRTQVVFGAGNADARLMFVGEAPGAREDEQGVPFVGASGKLLDELLAEVGLDRGDVFIANVLKCRPPGNRDPAPAEIERCRPYLHEQIALIEPIVVCTLGNFAMKLLRGSNEGITKLHGQPEVRQLGTRAVRLLPLYHPAAALYQRSLLDTLRADFARLPGLLEQGAPPQPEPQSAIEPEPAPVPAPELVAPPEPPAEPDSPPETEPDRASAPERADPPDQLGLF